MSIPSAGYRWLAGPVTLLVAGLVVASCATVSPAPVTSAPATPTQSGTAAPTATSRPTATAAMQGPATPTALPPTPTEAPAMTESPTPAAESTQGDTMASVQEVQVTLTEWSIQFSPATLKPGKVHFVINNPGNAPHALAVRGEDVDAKSATIQTGQSTTLDVDLKAGSYEFWCPVGQHKDRGMDAKLTVQ